MTSIRVKRCIHCGSTYGYQQSGYGCGDALNDDRYCPTCKGAVNDALSALPVLFEYRYIPVTEHPLYNDVTRADIEAWEADYERHRLETTALIGKRIWPALMDLETGEAQSIREVRATSGPHLGTRFRVSSWPKRPDYSIEIEIEWDIMRQTRVGLSRDVPDRTHKL